MASSPQSTGGSSRVSKSSPSKRIFESSPTVDPFGLHTMDSSTLKQDLEDADSLSDEDVGIIEALRLTQEQKHETAREKAEEILERNPANSIATYVTGLECENRQDWSEAARFYLMGLGQNPDDRGMELGFQTNLDMLRAVRHRWVNDQVTDKWDDVLSYKPKEKKATLHLHIHKSPWWRLGPLYEALVQDPEESEGREKQSYLQDLFSDSPDHTELRMELRRVLYQNMDFLDIVYEYYRLELTEDWPPDRRIETQVDHDGHDGDPHKLPFGRPAARPMTLRALIRLLKDTGIIYGDSKGKLLAAAVGRIHLQGRRRVARAKRAAPDYEAEAQDPHDAAAEVDFYDMIETLTRIAAIHARVGGTLAQRLEALLLRFLRPGAMRKTGDKGLAEFRSPPVQAILQEPAMAQRLRRVFEYFVAAYKASRLRLNAVGVRDVTMSLNHVLRMGERIDDFDPMFTPRRCWEAYQTVTCDSGLLPQEHPNNLASEMVFEEFCELLVRSARLKGAKGAPREFVHDYLESVIVRAGRLMPGKVG